MISLIVPLPIHRRLFLICLLQSPVRYTAVMARLLRYLRIAFSATCVIACVLLIALWVRSYWWSNRYDLNCFDSFLIHSDSVAGRLLFIGGRVGEWDVHEVCFTYSEPVDDWEHERDILYSSLSWEPNESNEGGGSLPVVAGFAIGRIDGSHIIMMPHWFLVLLSATLAAAPWMRWRFSMRTLLIATTLIAVVLGAIVYASG